MMTSVESSGEHVQLDIPDLPAGSYLVTINAGGDYVHTLFKKPNRNLNV
jgi:hypothetical protein